MQQLKLNITHAPGQYALIDTNGVVYGVGHVIQSSFYMPGDETEKQAKYEQLIAFAHGLIEGWNMARNALMSPRFEVQAIDAAEAAKDKWVKVGRQV